MALPRLSRYSDAELLALIRQEEQASCGPDTAFSTRRIQHFQTAWQAPYTLGVDYGPAFRGFMRDLSRKLEGRIYLPTQKKIFNNWAYWALEQEARRQAASSVPQDLR